MMENFLLALVMGGVGCGGALGIHLIAMHHEKRMKAFKVADKLHLKIMNLLFKQDNWRILMADFEAVDFDEVLEASARGEDIAKLYPLRLQALIAESAAIPETEPVSLN